MKKASGPNARCFVCVKPDLPIRRNLQAWLEPLRQEAPRLKWVALAGLHLTLKFCGEISQEQIQRLSAGLRTEMASVGPFPLGLEGTGFFPARGAPRVLWGGITGDREALAELFRKVEKVAVHCGIAREERPFSPHLTLARARAATDFPRGWLRNGLPSRAVWGTWIVREVTLMESELRPEGPIYSPIEKFSLLKFQGGGR